MSDEETKYNVLFCLGSYTEPYRTESIHCVCRDVSSDEARHAAHAVATVMELVNNNICDKHDNEDFIVESIVTVVPSNLTIQYHC